MDNTDIEVTKKIQKDEYTLFDKVMYGGLGYGYFCLPTNLFKVIFTVLFPPIGIIINSVGDVEKTFPYVRLENFKNLFLKIDQFIIALILTALFYVPGLVYVFSKLKLDNTNFTENTNNKNKDKFKNTKNTNQSQKRNRKK